MNKGTSILPPSDQEINELCKIINTNLGFKYDHQKKYLIVSRLKKHLAQLGFTTYRQYLEYLQTEPEEHSILFSLLTTNVTSFFREAIHFQYLKKVLLPHYRKVNTGPKKIRAWSAGCSSGEEPYSLAITLRESLGADWDIMILATDISAQKLTMGSKGGPYTREQVAMIPPHLLSKYFSPEKHKEETLYRATPLLRQLVAFQLVNLLDQQALPQHIRLNLIFCRNVFIYMAEEAKNQILSQFYSRLYPNGYLFLGLSESLNSSDSRWNSIGKSIYQKK
ncbi:MAG TPA: protein-glutamate O-methyltransferase [Firmicutes bacterium]|nr:protein-glutamate O-methyltransferase [Bacillota bacterium]